LHIDQHVVGVEGGLEHGRGLFLDQQIRRFNLSAMAELYRGQDHVVGESGVAGFEPRGPARWSAISDPPRHARQS
jgi:hypothetical protein